MLSGRSNTFSSFMTCFISESEPCGGSRSCLDCMKKDEETQNDFQQFGVGYDEFEREAKELADALEQYKLIHRRRYISFEEMLAILHSLGYKR